MAGCVGARPRPDARRRRGRCVDRGGRGSAAAPARGADPRRRRLRGTDPGRGRLDEDGGGIGLLGRDLHCLDRRARDDLRVDDAVAQRWAEFVASLVHGPELTRVRINLMPPREIRGTCGFTALACYDAGRASLYAPGQDVEGDPPAESIVAHEYGHHIAANRANNPWRAIDYGTKRWSTSMQVCARTETGVLSPGNETDSYRRNPGEGYAEAYRVLNERKLGRAETPWEIVDQLLYPDEPSLAALEQDVLNPWAAAQILRYTGSGRTRTYTVATPLDGTVRATLRSKGSVQILRPTGTRLAGGGATAAATVCSLRTVRVRVTRPASVAKTAFALTVTRP